jgi:serine/threonine protein kinase
VFFIVMEYVPGDTLEAVIEKDGTLDLGRPLDYTCQICNAMDHAHSKASSIAICVPATCSSPIRAWSRSPTSAPRDSSKIAAHGTTVIGSPPYMAPEQFQGKAVFASDIYSLGVTMYQMFTGVLPYNTPMPADLEKLMKGELASPPKLKNPEAAEGDQRHRDESDRPPISVALSTRGGSARSPCWRRARPAPSTIKRPWRPAPTATNGPSKRCRKSRPASRHAKRAGEILLEVRQGPPRTRRLLPLLLERTVTFSFRPARQSSWHLRGTGKSG